MRHRKWLQKTRGWTSQTLVPSTNLTGSHIFPDLSLHGWSPEALSYHKESPPYPRVTRNPRGMSPMDDLRTKWNRHKQPVRGTSVRHLTINICLSDPLFNIPGDEDQVQPIGEELTITKVEHTHEGGSEESETRGDVKFSELTIDMFRMLQALEREPINLATQTSKQGTLEPNEKPAKRENPHKYLLYKPTFSQLFTFLSASFKELPANSVLLVYLSATGIFPAGHSDYE
ncbi:unnamed protein product, partial [Pleuronectes platessa]